MPTNRKRRVIQRRARTGELTKALRHFLETGVWWHFLSGGESEPDETEIQGLWEAHRDAILPDYIAAHPGQRPYFFWRFDVPEGIENIPSWDHMARTHLLDDHGLLSEVEKEAMNTHAK